MIRLDNVGFQYRGASRMALNGISLDLAAGDYLGVIGPSGAGKSTLTYALNGVVPHHYDGDFYGQVTIDKMDTALVSPTDISRVVGSVFQDIDAQMISSMVEDEMLFALENYGFPAEEIEPRMARAMEQVGISDLRLRSLDSLSGGQKQRVAIAAIMALTPKILVLDEPTGELDPQNSRRVFDVLDELNRLGTTIVVVEQKIMLLSEHVKRLAVMNEGKIVLEGPVREVVREPGRLKELGVNCPRVCSLWRELHHRGLYEGEPPVTVNEAYLMVREALK